ncbi:MAG: bacteriohemerythrin [Nitrospinota bacterium]
MPVEWNESYAVGVEEFDLQHKDCFVLLNRIFEAFKAGDEEETIIILDELVDYATSHFKSEEDAMEKFGYSEIIEHKSEHNKLMSQLVDFVIYYGEEGSIHNAEIAKFLIGWLDDHIAKTDKKYTSFFNGKGLV